MTKGENQYSYTDEADDNGLEVNLLDRVVAGGTFLNGVFTVSQSQNHGSATLSSRGVAGSDYLSGFQAGASVVRVMHVFALSAGRWSSPSRNLGFLVNNGERVFGYEILGSKPTNLDGNERVVYFDATGCVDNFWLNDEYPKQSSDSKRINEGNESFLKLANSKVRAGGKATNNNDQREVNPSGSRAVNVIVGHEGQTIAGSLKVSTDSVTKEGIQADGK